MVTLLRVTYKFAAIHREATIIFIRDIGNAITKNSKKSQKHELILNIEWIISEYPIMQKKQWSESMKLLSTKSDINYFTNYCFVKFTGISCVYGQVSDFPFMLLSLFCHLPYPINLIISPSFRFSWYNNFLVIVILY